MTYQERSKSNSDGLLLVDAVIALALVTSFVVIISAISILSSQLLRTSKVKNALLSTYTEHYRDFDLDKLGQHVTYSYISNLSSTTIVVTASTSPYGNLMIENDIVIRDGYDLVRFTKVRMDSEKVLDRSGSSPFCSVDFRSHAVVGSYDYYNRNLFNDPVPIVKAYTLPVSAGIYLTDLIVRNGLLYVSADSSVYSDPDLFVFELKEGNAYFKSSINTGPGIAAMALVGDYVFGAAASTASQLHIIHVGQDYSLYLSKKYQIPLPESSTSPPVASAIYVRGNTVYLGTEKWNGSELNIIDVTNITSPIKLSGYETSSKINNIFVGMNEALISASDSLQLRRLNVSDPYNPYLISGFSPSGFERQEGKVSLRFENSEFFGRTSGGFNIVADKELFTWPDMSGLDVAGGVYGLIADKHYIYVAQRKIGIEFLAYKRGSTATAFSYSLPAEPERMTCDNDAIYVLARNKPEIYEISF